VIDRGLEELTLMPMQCVREQSAIYSRVENIGLPVDHYGLNKFKSKDNESYKSIVRKLLSLIEPIAAQKQRRLYSVPVSTAETYTERQKLSTAVVEGLRVRHEKAIVPYALAIYGLGGTGKTQLALKYIEDYKDKYSPIFWIDAKDKESVLSSYERCAGELQLQVSPRQAQSTSLVDSPTVQAVLRWLENRKKTDDAWLVVIDNADDFSSGIKRVIPRGDRGSIVITSQDSHARKLVDGGCEAVRVDTMERLEARTLLLHHLQLDPDLVTADVIHECDKVAEQLGYLALAIDLAGAYISNDDTDPEQALRRYLQRYTRHKDSLLRSEDSRGLLASEKTVWTVWDTTLEKIEALEVLEDSSSDLPARLLLHFLAQFRGAIVQDELFRLASSRVLDSRDALYDGAAALPSWLSKALAVEMEEWDDYYYKQTRDRLVRYSLLQRTGGEWPGVLMHGLVQWRAKKYEEEQPWEKWHLITVLAACTQLSGEKARPQFRRELVAHVPTVGKTYLDELEIKEKKRVFVWRTVSTVYFDEGRWKEAEELQLQVMETCKTKLGTDHPDTLTSMANLASTYRNQGRWDDAEKLFVQLMKTSKTRLGADHPDTLISMNNLASTFWSQGRWDDAEKLFVQVIEKRKTKLGADHPDTLTSMANLAFTWKAQDRSAEAIVLMRQCMQQRQRVLKASHPDLKSSLAALEWWEAEGVDLFTMYA
jgi:tetratricopeptide (TPR) repeat protein